MKNVWLARIKSPDSCMAQIKQAYQGFGHNEKIILALFTAVFCYSFYKRLIITCAVYPVSYKWQELCISWAGGVIRRGFLGEIFATLPASPHFVIYILIIFIALYAIWYYALIRILFRSFNHFWAIVILGSPLMGAFIVQAQDGFLRKDLFIFLYVALSFWLLARFQGKYYLTILFSALTYALFFLIHELTLLYSGLVFLLIWQLYPDAEQRKATAIYIFTICICSLVFLYFFSGSPEAREAIYNFWENRIPGFRTQASWSAIDFIGVGLDDRPEISTSLPYLFRPELLASIIKGFLLAFAPLAALFYDYDIHSLHKKLFGAYGAWFFYGIAFGSFAVIIYAMNDFGRIFSDYALYLVLYLGMLIRHARKRGIEPSSRLAFSMRHPSLFLFAFCYLFLWKMECCAPLSAHTILSLQLWQTRLLGLKDWLPEV